MESASRGVNALECVVYTNNARMSGDLQTAHGRISEALNSPGAEFLTIKDARVTSLFGMRLAERHASSVMVRREDAIIVALTEGGLAAEKRLDPFFARPSRSLKPIVLQTGPFIVGGTMHIPAGLDSDQHIADTVTAFMALTDAEVVHDATPDVRTHLPFVMVNRRWIQAVMEDATLPDDDGAPPAGPPATKAVPEAAPPPPAVPDVPPAAPAPQPASASAPGTPAPASPPTPSEVRVTLWSRDVAEVLIATEVFRQADPNTLARAIAVLEAAGRMTSKSFYTGTQLIREGDPGSTLYVVEAGTLEVVTRDNAAGRTRRVAELARGDIFGEIAVFGDGHRTASVIGIEPGTVIEVEEDAFIELVTAFPRAIATLLHLWVQRRPARPGFFTSLK